MEGNTSSSPLESARDQCCPPSCVISTMDRWRGRLCLHRMMNFWWEWWMILYLLHPQEKGQSFSCAKWLRVYWIFFYIWISFKYEMYKHDAFFDITLLDILNAWYIAIFWLGNSEYNFSINADKILVNFDYQHETCGMMKKNPGGMMLVVLRVRHTPLIIT